MEAMRTRVWIVAFTISVLAGARLLGVTGGPRIVGAVIPSVGALEAVGRQVFPKDPKLPYYVECINLPENGIAPIRGNDYSGCPLTDRMRARLVQKQTHL